MRSLLVPLGIGLPLAALMYVVINREPPKSRIGKTVYVLVGAVVAIGAARFVGWLALP